MGMYTIDELLAIETIEIHPTYGEMKINTDTEKVYLNGRRRIAVDWYCTKHHCWKMSIY